MIFSNEIRLNNWYRIEQKGIGWTNIQITENVLSRLFGDDITLALQDLYPIKLKADHFRKHMEVTGFSEDWFEFGNEGFEFSFVHNGFVTVEEATRINAKPIHYLHQVQNMYLCLTGNELELRNYDDTVFYGG